MDLLEGAILLKTGGGAILSIIQRMIAIDALLAGDGLVIDVAAEQLAVVGRSVRRSLDTLRQLAGLTVFEIDEATGRHRHWCARGVKPLFAANIKVKRRQGRRRTS